MHHFNSLVLILQMGNASLIHIRITGVLSVFKLNNRLTAAARHVRKHSLKQKRVDSKQSYLTRPAYTAYTMVGRVGLAYPKHGNSTEFHQGMYPTPMETIVQLMRLQDSSKTKQISHSAPPCLESWPGKNSMRNPGDSQFLTAWFAGLHNRHSSWYRLDDELQEIRVTHTVSRRQYTTISLWPVHVSDLSVAPKQTVVIVTSRKSLEILSSSMHVYATFVAARPLPSHCRWCLMLPHQEWSSYPWGFWPCSWAAENMATSLYDASLWHVASPTNSCLAP